MHRPISAAQRR